MKHEHHTLDPLCLGLELSEEVFDRHFPEWEPRYIHVTVNKDDQDKIACVLRTFELMTESMIPEKYRDRVTIQHLHWRDQLSLGWQYTPEKTNPQRRKMPHKRKDIYVPYDIWLSPSDCGEWENER